jgi:hypothetical protein
MCRSGSINVYTKKDSVELLEKIPSQSFGIHSLPCLKIGAPVFFCVSSKKVQVYLLVVTQQRSWSPLMFDTLMGQHNHHS